MGVDLGSPFSIKAPSLGTVYMPLQSLGHHLGTETHNLAHPAQRQNKRGLQSLFSFPVKRLRNKSEFGVWLSCRYEIYFHKSILQAALDAGLGGKLLTKNTGTKQEAASNGHHCVHPLLTVRSATRV